MTREIGVAEGWQRIYKFGAQELAMRFGLSKNGGRRQSHREGGAKGYF